MQTEKDILKKKIESPIEIEKFLFHRGFVNRKLTIKNRALVSMGAVGAIAPMVSESVGASTHGFW